MLKEFSKSFKLLGDKKSGNWGVSFTLYRFANNNVYGFSWWSFNFFEKYLTNIFFSVNHYEGIHGSWDKTENESRQAEQDAYFEKFELEKTIKQCDTTTTRRAL